MTKEQSKALANIVAENLHRHDYCAGAQAVVDGFKLERFKLKKNQADEAYHPILTTFLHNLLENNLFISAANILWTPNQFSAEPQSVREVWELFDTSNMGLIMGAAKMGKSYSMGARLFLEYVRDPQWTSVRVVGPSEDHLEENLFSHLVALHNQATLPMPGEIGELFIGLNRRNQLGAIGGLVIPKGASKKAGRLQGGHRRPRPSPHPIFGKLSRLFIFIDEIENVPVSVWKDIDNVLSEIENGSQGFKIFAAYNPSDLSHKVATQAEPAFGWNEVDENVHYKWRSKRGWDVLRLDAERCENVIQNRIIYPGLQTREGLDTIALNAGGTQGDGYRTMGRGMYPQVGAEATVVPAGMLPKMRGEFIWLNSPEPVVADDYALEGSDEAIRTIGKFGLATGMKLAPTLSHPEGQTVMFKDRNGQIMPRYGLEATVQLVMPKGDTVVMKNNVLLYNRRAGVRPEYYACDRTGNGAGIADLIKNEWSSLINDVNYSQGCTAGKLMEEDTRDCKDEYNRIDTELWFGLRQWGEFGYFLINPSVSMEKLMPQLTNRRFRTLSGKKKVESKKDYKTRIGGSQPSPNEADSMTLLVYAARKGSGLTLSMRGKNPDVPDSGDFDDWPQAGVNNGVRIDPTNATDFLDQREAHGEPIL